MKKIILVAAFLLIAGPMLAGGRVSAFVRRLSGAFGRELDKEQEEAVQAIVQAFERYGDGDTRKLVYIIATAWHESRLRPIKEIRAKPGTEIYTIQNTYWATGFFGRGYVQLTHRYNYEKAGKFLGLDLVASPDLALQPGNAAAIMVAGMMSGMFTGRKLSEYIGNQGADYYAARKTVGAIMVAGKDTAALIVGHVQSIFNALK